MAVAEKIAVGQVCLDQWDLFHAQHSLLIAIESTA
jgi:hypothetical protein